MRTYQVPVMVTVEAESSLDAPDSSQVAEVLHGFCFATDVALDPDGIVVVQSIDGIPADEDDPNGPPVPARPTWKDIIEIADEHGGF